MESCKEKYVILLLMGAVLVFCRKGVQSKRDMDLSISEEQGSYEEVDFVVVPSEEVVLETTEPVKHDERDIRVLLTDSLQESPVLDSVLLVSEEVLVMEGAHSGEYPPGTLLVMEDVLDLSLIHI